MSDLTLTLGIKLIALSFGDPVSVVEAQMGEFAHTTTRDMELRRTYIEAPDHGVELLLQDDRLSSVFLQIAPDDTNTAKPFTGRLSLLPEDFFANPSADRMREALAANGFSEWPKKYPNALDMVRPDLRVRYTERRGGARLLIDDSRTLRALQP